MKRGGSLKRTSLARKQGIGSPSSWKRAVRPLPSWQSDVAALHGDKCWITGEPAQAAHHCLPQNVLKRELRAVTTDDELRAILSDPRNGLPISEQAHSRHELGTVTRDEHGNSVDHRIRYESLPSSAVDFVVELDERYGTRLAARLETLYPSMSSGESA